MHCTRREIRISLEMHLPKYDQIKGRSTVNEQRPNRDCALQTGPITWTLGAKGGVLLLRLWLWISKIKQQKCNKTKTSQKQQKPTVHYKHNNRSVQF